MSVVTAREAAVKMLVKMKSGKESPTAKHDVRERKILHELTTEFLDSQRIRPRLSAGDARSLDHLSDDEFREIECGLKTFVDWADSEEHLWHEVEGE
jgi:hypothetical protein